MPSASLTIIRDLTARLKPCPSRSCPNIVQGWPETGQATSLQDILSSSAATTAAGMAATVTTVTSLAAAGATASTATTITITIAATAGSPFARTFRPRATRFYRCYHSIHAVEFRIIIGIEFGALRPAVGAPCGTAGSDLTTKDPRPRQLPVAELRPFWRAALSRLPCATA